MSDNDQTHEGLPVAGYRKQSAYAVAAVNALKSIEASLLTALDELEKDGELAPDRRWLAIARTNIEQGFMAANRAVFKPARLSVAEVQAMLLEPEQAEFLAKRRVKVAGEYLASFMDKTKVEEGEFRDIVAELVGEALRGFMPFLMAKGGV